MSTTERMSFAMLLRRYRLASGLSQEQLAERAGLSVQAVSTLERGVRQAPYRDTVRVLAKALELTREEHVALDASVARSRRTHHAPDTKPPPSVSPRDNLPLPPTRLIGRDREVGELADLLCGRETGLLTLVGPGGVGKTRLGMQVARDVSAHFADGVIFVPLAPLRDPALVASAIARALDVREMTGEEVVDGLRAHLQDKNLLLLLDNFEHVAASAPLLAGLLGACPRLAIFVTSRAPAHLRGERVYPLSPLPTPDLADLPPLDTLATIPSVALLVERAHDLVPEFRLGATNAAAVAALCRQLDGLPLALELAAARLTVLSPRVLLERLEHRLSLLGGGPRDLPERQQTLRATLAWSYDLLTIHEQALFRRLAVFAGGCTLEAVEAICAAEDGAGIDVIDWLTALIDKSLLRRVGSAAGDPRFGLLEIVRQYGLERLIEAGEVEHTRSRHAAYYLALVETAERDLTGPGQGAALARLEQDYDNLRAALGWAREATGAAGEAASPESHGIQGEEARWRREVGLRMAGALWRFWYLRGNRVEGRRWLEDLLAHTGEDGAAPPAVRAKALRGAGVLATEQGDYERAGAFCTESLALYRSLGDSWGSAAVLNVLAALAKYQGDYERATALYAESLPLWRALGDTRMVGATLNNMGAVAIDLGDFDRAGALLEEGLAVKQGLGDTQGRAVSLTNLGDVARHRGDYERAIRWYEEALALARELGSKDHAAVALNNLGEAAREQGDYEQAARHGRDSLVLFRDLGDKRGIALGLHNLGLIASAHGQQARAARLCASAAVLRDANGIHLPPSDQAFYDHAMSAARLALGDDGFASAWEDGRALPLDRAIADALEE